MMPIRYPLRRVGYNAGWDANTMNVIVRSGHLVLPPNDTAPIEIDSGRMVINGAFGSSFAIRSDGDLMASGWNEAGQLGNGTIEGRDSFASIMDNVVTVSAGRAHTMAIRTDGGLWAWGDNTGSK